jgi:hypothetical protein
MSWAPRHVSCTTLLACWSMAKSDAHGCVAGVAYLLDALQVWHTSWMRCRCGIPLGCVAGVAYLLDALQVWHTSWLVLDVARASSMACLRAASSAALSDSSTWRWPNGTTLNIFDMRQETEYADFGAAAQMWSRVWAGTYSRHSFVRLKWL